MSQSTTSTSPDLDPLLSLERMDRASPDLWPEQMPGVTEFAALSPPAGGVGGNGAGGGSAPGWVQELEKEDVAVIQELGSLSVEQLMEKVRSLQSLAYTLGMDEAREMTRGKFLNILEKPTTGRKY